MGEVVCMLKVFALRDGICLLVLFKSILFDYSMTSDIVFSNDAMRSC